MRKITLILSLLSIVWLSSCKKDEEGSTPEVAVKIGALAPDFNLADANGTFFKLSDYRGKYVVVDFWAAWCSICRTENPKMEALYNNYKNKNVQFIGACLDANVDNWKNVVAEDGLTYLQLHDAEAFDSDVAKTYGLQMVPFMMLLDESGKILTFTSRVVDIESRLASEF
jgi:peroxiredoxin